MKKVPEFKTDEEAEAFLEQDLSDYLHKEQLIPVQFEFLPKTQKVNMRFSEPLLQSAKARAKVQGISYQKFIRLAVEQALNSPPPTDSA